MDKKTILRVFGEAFLRSMVVLMAIAIIGFSIFFIIKVNTDKKAESKESTAEATTEITTEDITESTTEITTEATTEITTEATTEVQQIPSTEKNILILNSTSVTGLASAWMRKLNNEGFANTAIGNYSISGEAQTMIYVAEEGMGEDLLQYFNGATITVGLFDSTNYTIKSGAAMDTIDIIIVIGNSDTTVQ